MIANVKKMLGALTGHTRPTNKGCGLTAADTDPVQSHGATTTEAFNEAKMHRHEEITAAIIAGREELENTNAAHDIALRRGAKQGYTETVQALIAAGAEITVADNTGCTRIVKNFKRICCCDDG